MKNLLLILLACTSISASAQKFTFNQGKATTSGYYEEIPYEDFNSKLIIKVQVNGAEHRFLFDTGSPNIVSNKLAEGQPVILKDTMRDVNGTASGMSVISSDFKLGNTTFAGIPAIKGLPPVAYNCWGIEGVIGSNMIRNSVVKIDAERHVLIITDQRSRVKLNSKNATPMVPDAIQSMPVIKILLASKLYETVDFDCGNNEFLHVTKAMTDDINQRKLDLFKITDTGNGANSIGALGMQKDEQKERMSFYNVNIGGTQFNNVITDNNVGGTPSIGAGILKYANITLDFPKGKFYVDAKKPVNDLTTKNWPIQPNVVDGKLIVAMVWSKAVGKVQLGEQIVSINEISFENIQFCDFINKSDWLKGLEVATYTFKDKDGKLHKEEFKKE